MSLLVKICGLSTRETLDVALAAGADMVGFVFFPLSPRHLSLETARDLGRHAKGRAVKVALTVDGPARHAEVLLAAVPERGWQTTRWREGSKGWLKARFCALRCWREPSEGVRIPGWLIGERPARGGSDKEKWKYHWSNFSAEATLEEMVEYAHRRYGVEQFHEEAKGLLGWDQYQGRLWPGFHRNSVLVMLAYSFLVKQEWEQRQQVTLRGRPRRAFSPSSRSPARVSA